VRTLTIATLCLIITACFAAGTANAATPYVLTELPTLPGGYGSRAYGINELGHVVGEAQTATGLWHAFFWTPEGGMIDLGARRIDQDESMARTITDNGMVVGYSHSGHGYHHAFVWENGTRTDLVRDGDVYTAAYGANSSGLVVGGGGGVYTGNGWLWQEGTWTDLGNLGGTDSEALAINDGGDIVGWARNQDNQMHAFLHTGGVMNDLGALPAGSLSVANAVNESAQIVGYSTYSGYGHHAFIWESGTWTDLGTFGGTDCEALGINDSGDVVGSAQTTLGATHAFLWRNGVKIDLNSATLPYADWTELTVASAVNNSGQIVGWGTANGQISAFVLTPIPEPSTLLLVALGAVGLLLRKGW